MNVPEVIWLAVAISALPIAGIVALSFAFYYWATARHLVRADLELKRAINHKLKLMQIEILERGVHPNARVDESALLFKQGVYAGLTCSLMALEGLE